MFAVTLECVLQRGLRIGQNGVLEEQHSIEETMGELVRLCICVTDGELHGGGWM